MTIDDQVRAIEEFGSFTRRQAAFLSLVARHSGVFLPRQYDAFADIASGEARRRFAARVVELKLATAYPCTGGRAHIYHLPTAPCTSESANHTRGCENVAMSSKAIERLIVLDAVIAKPELEWLASEREKVDHFIRRHAVSLADLLQVTFGAAPDQTRRFFPERRPIGVGSIGEITLMYPIVEPTARLFNAFMESHRRLLKHVTQWRVLLVVHRSLKSAERAHRRVLQDFCAPPVATHVADEFRWYCHARRANDQAPLAADARGERDRYVLARRAFSAPRFYSAYRRWLIEGDASLVDLQSPLFHDAARRPRGVLDVLVLPFTYGHLTPALSDSGVSARRAR
jgi:hypothetical protein